MPRTREISNTNDVIDSRDVIARIAELESEAEAIDCSECGGSGTITLDHSGNDVPCMDCDGSGLNTPELDEDDAAELAALKALEDEASGSPDWRHGETLIADSYFEDYARQLADDLGLFKGDNQWPYRCIDWKQAAEELQQDYTSVDYDGATYWIRG